jgi:GNAT superfamily N-acetyltransferase
MGLLRLYSVRKDGELIGYAIYTDQARHPHYPQRWATSNLIYLKPEYRRGGIGFGLLEFIEDDLVGYVMQTAVSESHPALGMLLSARGHAKVEAIYSKRL